MRAALIVILTALSVVTFKALVIDHTPNPLRAERFAGDLQNAEIADFNGAISYLGMNRPESVASGEKATISLFWTPRGDVPERDVSSHLSLLTPNGFTIAQSEHFYPGGRATTQWLPGTYIADVHTLSIPPGTPPGSYTLRVALMDHATQRALNVMNASGNPTAPHLDVSGLTITRGKMLSGDATPLSDALALLNDSLAGLPEAASVGDALAFSWGWRARAAMAEDARVRLLWRDAQGRQRAASPWLTLAPSYPTRHWRTGEAFTAHQRATVPATLPAGEYHLALEISGTDAPHALGHAITISTPPRIFSPPPMTPLEAVRWQNGLRLLGYELSEERLRLVWQTENLLADNLRLFVHALEGERILAQTDGIPVNWTRPTTGWLPGEIIVTEHVLSAVNLNAVNLRVGWYDPLTGERAQLQNGADSLLLK